jgi:glycosyltransferase involved in cell wall biosynthesis
MGTTVRGAEFCIIPDNAVKLSVLIPVYNEARTIGEVLSQVLSVPVEKEILVVDDGSTDGTREALKDWDGKAGVRVILHERNLGKGRALATALREARGDILLIQDADLEYDPADYPAMLKPIESGRADVVYGSRFRGAAENRVQNFWHTVGNRALTLVSNVVTDLNLTDMATCYKVFHRRVVPSLDLQSPRFGIDAEITAKIARGGFRIFEVPVSYFARSRAEGKKIRLRDGFAALGALVRYRFFWRPAGPLSRRRWKPIAVAAAAAALAALSLLLVRDHAREDSLSADEPIHILGGYLQAAGQNAIVNIEHPPLMKELAGLALMTLPLPPPPPAAQVPMGNRFIDYGHAFLFGSNVPVDRIVAAARAPFLLVLALLLLMIFLAARTRYGNLAALFAVALVALDPNFVAHAGVVHTDLGAAAAFLAAVLAWERVRTGHGWAALALAGLVLGLALLTKFSCVYLVPILLLQTLTAPRHAQSPGRELTRALGRLALAGLVAIAIVGIGYAVVSSRMDRAAQQQIIHEMVALRGAPGLSLFLERVAAYSPPLGHYLGGLASVYRQNAEGGGVNFLFGRVSEHGFASYFFVAFLAKSTVAFLAVTVVVAALCVKDRAASEARLWLVPVGILFLASMGASYNIGIRHMLPVYPFLALAGAGAVSRLREGGRSLAAILLAALPLLSAVELARIHPHELSYFNPFVGGPLGGRRILSDSNVDWGLDLERLSAELSRRGVANPTVVYFGGDDVFERIGVPDFSAEPRVRGRLVAISAFHWAEGPAFYAYHGAAGVAAALARLRQELTARGRWIGRVGYSIDLYDLPPEEAHAR